MKESREGRRYTGPVCLITAFLVLVAPVAFGQRSPEAFDVVLQGGRVMDPETGFDAVRSVGIRGDTIVEISAAPLRGATVLDVTGLVVAPGFVDPHAHGQTNEANQYQARDGVTTALELEDGVAFVKPWLDSRTGNALINFGATIAHSAARWASSGAHLPLARKLRAAADSEGLSSDLAREIDRAVHEVRYTVLTEKEAESAGEALSAALSEGALGIGVSVGYYPGASRDEIFRVYAFAAKMGVPIYTHVRAPDIPAIQEAIANAAGSGASLHIVHINSMALGEIGLALDMVKGAEERGLDVTTELYPYTAGSTGLGSTLFDEGWQKVWNMTYGDLQWVETGERLTKETFEKYRERGGTVILHMMKEEWIEEGLRRPFSMIGSDGMPYAPGAHPRSAGTYSRLLGRYVRERKVLPLMDALAKITWMPARRVESVAPAMRRKGRLQVGCDADITVFDPETVIDTATFESELSFSEGIHHVLVNGTFVVRDAESVRDVYPGRPVMGKYRR